MRVRINYNIGITSHLNNLNLKLFKIKEEANICSTSYKNLKNEINEIVNNNSNSYKTLKSDLNKIEEKLANVEINSKLTKLDLKFLVLMPESSVKDLNEKIKSSSNNNNNNNINCVDINNNEDYEELINLDISSKMFEQKIRSIKEMKSDKNNNELKAEYSKYKDQIKNIFYDINQEINDLIEESDKLSKENQILKSKFEEKNKALLITLICNRCNLNYLVKNNNDTSCIYHPGKINYFSCKGCGQDEYYTCCSRCSKCSNGCKYSKHVTEII